MHASMPPRSASRIFGIETGKMAAGEKKRRRERERERERERKQQKSANNCKHKQDGATNKEETTRHKKEYSNDPASQGKKPKNEDMDG